MGRLTTHILDTAHGCPAAGVAIRLYRRQGEQRQLLLETESNADGRCDRPLLEGGDFCIGEYELQFAIGDYFAGKGFALAEPRFLDVITLNFGISDGQAHYHVPLLASPYSFSTYRGS